MVYVFLANGFEEIEALTPVDVLRRGGVEVITVGVGSKTIVGSHNIMVEADMVDSELTEFSKKLEGIVLPGGMPGTLNLEACNTVQQAIRYCDKSQLIIGAICAAPSVLGHAGILMNKKAVCFPSFESEMRGYLPTDEYVCRDGHIITAKGMGVSLEFSLMLLAAFRNSAVSDKVRTSIQCR